MQDKAFMEIINPGRRSLESCSDVAALCMLSIQDAISPYRKQVGTCNLHCSSSHGNVRISRATCIFIGVPL